MPSPVEQVADLGQTPMAIAQRWIDELTLSIKFWSPYQKRCEKILKRYEDDRPEAVKSKRRFAIFWSNIETLKPTVYAQVPKCVVTRRFNDPDPIGRVASEILERAINFSADAYDFDQVLKDCRDEFLLLAKAQSWTRYAPTFEDAPQTEAAEIGAPEDGDAQSKDSGTGNAAEEAPDQKVAYEQVFCDYVNYQDWGTNKCRNWSEVRFIWRRCYMDRQALVKRFGKEIGNKVPLDFKPDGKSSAEGGDQFKQAQVYEIWDKPSKTVFWISMAYPQEPLDKKPDLLNLPEFWPCPKPVFGTLSPRSIVPIPDYVQYQDQCEEVDDLTTRISVLTDAVRMVGVYASDEKINLQQVFKKSSENDMIPVETWGKWMEKGGIKGLIEWVPVDMVIRVLEALYKARDVAIQVIYQITGISDIMRGDTDPNETAAAQERKSTWGTSRVRDKQKDMARFCRDDMRIKGNVIAKKFSIETIKTMTNFALLTNAEKMQIQQWQAATEALAAQQAQQQAAMQAQAQPQPPQPGQPPMPQAQPPQPPFPPDKMKLLNEPSWEDVDALFKSDRLLQFRIDIEADTTIEPDLVQARSDATAYVTAMGGLISQALPAVQAAPALGEYLGEVIKAASRLYPFGRQFEEVIDRTMSNIGKQPPAPPDGANKGPTPEELMIDAQKNQNDLAKLQNATQLKQMDMQISAGDNQAEIARAQADERIANTDAYATVQAAAMKPAPKPANGATN